MSGDNPIGAVNQQERPDALSSALLLQDLISSNAKGILRGHTQGSLVKPRDEDMVHAPWRRGELHEL
jgi:hypothetical protein